MRPTAQAKQILIQVNLDSNAGTISGDPDRLQQIIWNLLSNAIKFTPAGGRVEITLERVGTHVEITVTDTGQGIDAEFLPHVFERLSPGRQLHHAEVWWSGIGAFDRAAPRRTSRWYRPGR